MSGKPDASNKPCPKCGKELMYKAGALMPSMVLYPVSCSYCGWKGYTCYLLDFECYTDEDGNDLTGTPK